MYISKEKIEDALRKLDEKLAKNSSNLFLQDEKYINIKKMLSRENIF